MVRRAPASEDEEQERSDQARQKHHDRDQYAERAESRDAFARPPAGANVQKRADRDVCDREPQSLGSAELHTARLLEKSTVTPRSMQIGL